MGVRLEPADEYMHELGPEPTFNESMYFNFYDPTAELGGFVRLGNRANEGYAEMTVCVYLPDGRVAFMFKRPEISDNDAFDAGGASFEVVTPFEALKVAYAGKVVMLDDPLQMADPKTAFTDNPYEACEIRLDYRGLSPMFGGEPDEPHERPGEEFARGHYEQLVGARGSVRVGDQEWEVDGHGLRDHSWGPRTWQAPWYYRWLTANFGDGFGFMASRIARRDSEGTRGGFVWDGDRLHLVDHVTVATDWEGDDRYHRSVRATLRSREGAEWSVEGEVLNLIPLRNRRQGPDGQTMVTRISEGMTRWRLTGGADGDGGEVAGRVGYGLSEYLDQIIDGAPVGIDE
jgi:hypothetical protein